MSIRNLDADLAASKLNELFHLHRYDDCVLLLNRLNHLTIKQIVSQVSVDIYLSRLPYTIEIFEAIYAKIFIMDPDNFPIRTLKPERLIDKMVAYFSMLSDPTKMEPIDGAKLLDSFENCIRIISYVQPSLYSRLLYFKYAIDKSLLKLEKDFAMFNHLNMDNNDYANAVYNSNNHKHPNHHLQSSSAALSSLFKNNNAITNALVVSRASNMQTCESMETELATTVANCEKALIKLHEYINNLKSQKIFKDVQAFLSFQQQQKQMNDTNNNNNYNNNANGSKTGGIKNNLHLISGTGTLGKSSSKKTTSSGSKRSSSLSRSMVGEAKPTNNVIINDDKTLNSIKVKRAESKDRHSNENDEKSKILQLLRKEDSIAKSAMNLNTGSSCSFLYSSTICQDFIQNRLYLNKSMMNSIEPFLQTIKLQQLISNLYEKIESDKEILLVYSHLKREEKHLNSLEPLQPLFKRYALGFERCIQIWRRKCSADTLLLYNDSQVKNIMHQSTTTLLTNNNTNNNNNPALAATASQLYYIDSEESAQIDRLHSSYEYTSSPLLSRAAANQQTMILNSASLVVNESQDLINTTATATNSNDINNNSKPQPKYHSELNLYRNNNLSNYSTLPAKLKKIPFIEDADVPHAQDSIEQDNEEVSRKPPISRRVDSSSAAATSASNNQQLTRTPILKSVHLLNNADSNDLLSSTEYNQCHNGTRRRPESQEKSTSNDVARQQTANINRKSSNADSELSRSEETFLALIEQQTQNKKQKQEIDSLILELESAKEIITKLRKTETSLREKVEIQEKEIEKVQAEKLNRPANLNISTSTSTISSPHLNDDQNNQMQSYLLPSPSTPPTLNAIQISLDLVKHYTNLNTQYRLEAYDSLDSLKEIQNAKEFKLKLLFSVIVLSHRFVRLFIRDLKRKIKTILQISDRGVSSERVGSIKSQAMTPTIMVQKAEEEVARRLSMSREKILEADETNETTTTIAASNAAAAASISKLKQQQKQQAPKVFKFSSQISSGESGSSSQKFLLEYAENSGKLIENALNKYLQIVSATNMFDVNKIVEDVKEQLWSTLYDYPLRDCQELNSYIAESVKTCWLIANHQPPFKLEYGSTKFDPNFHVRSVEESNDKNDSIVQYVWPSLIDTADNSCLVKGIVIT